MTTPARPPARRPRDRTVHRTGLQTWHARPVFRGVRLDLGTFRSEAKARAAMAAFAADPTVDRLAPRRPRHVARILTHSDAPPFKLTVPKFVGHILGGWHDGRRTTFDTEREAAQAVADFLGVHVVMLYGPPVDRRRDPLNVAPPVIKARILMLAGGWLTPAPSKPAGHPGPDPNKP